MAVAKDISSIDGDYDYILNYEEEEFVKSTLEQIEISKFDDIYSICYYNSVRLRNIIKKIRKVKKYTLYKNQRIDQRYENILSVHDMLNFNAIYTLGDGNCFYRALSHLLYDNQEKFFIFKMLNIFMLLEYREFFKEYIELYNGLENFNEFVVKTSIKNSWANQYNIIAASILLNRGIFLFSEHKNILKYNLTNNDENPIVICLGFNHFVPLCCKTDDSLTKMSLKADMLINYRDNFIIKMY